MGRDIIVLEIILGQTLKLDIPKDIYQTIEKYAKEQGCSTEEVASEWLATVKRSIQQDPVEQFFGAVRSNVPDWTENHDKYLEQNLSKKVVNNDLLRELYAGNFC